MEVKKTTYGVPTTGNRHRRRRVAESWMENLPTKNEKIGKAKKNHGLENKGEMSKAQAYITEESKSE